MCGYQGGGCKAQMLTLSSAWIGRWQMALWGACDTGVSEQAGEHMKGRLCRHVASGCQQGCDEVRPVAWGKEGGAGGWGERERKAS